MVVSRRGIDCYSAGSVADLARAKFYAWGVGDDLAVGAMEMGATAEQAVRVAIKHNVYCGAPVRLFRV